VTSLEPLLALQERDLALDRLRHRRETLPERAALADAQARVTALEGDLARARTERDAVLAEERRFDDQAQSTGAQADEHEKRLYSGEISSPRDLQALQQDVEHLRRRQRELEDQQLATMERREPLDEEVARVERELAQAADAVVASSGALAAAEAEVDGEAAGEQQARDEVASGIDADVVADYERRRAKANGVGAARLVGNTCQGCHLTIPATEVDRIRKAPPGTVATCDNCGCILVP
jgi:predicted  nucleic acid-binding Zn-ribbon protein